MTVKSELNWKMQYLFHFAYFLNLIPYAPFALLHIYVPGILEILVYNPGKRKKHNENKLIWLHKPSFVSNLMASTPSSV